MRWSRLCKSPLPPPVLLGVSFFFIIRDLHRSGFGLGATINGVPCVAQSGSSWATGDGEAAVAFLRILLGCLVGMCCYSLFLKRQRNNVLSLTLFPIAETTSFHGGITLASILILTGIDYVARWRKCQNPPSSIRQQLRYVPYRLALQSVHSTPAFIFPETLRLDTPTYLYVCSTLRSPSSCSSSSSPSGDRISKAKGTYLLPYTYTRCRWKVRSCTYWTTTCSTGHG